MNVEIEFQNENLVAKAISPSGRAQTLASVPDLISIIDSETGEPITTDTLKYGLRVAVITIPCSPLLKEPKALEFVGPRAFGYK